MEPLTPKRMGTSTENKPQYSHLTLPRQRHRAPGCSSFKSGGSERTDSRLHSQRGPTDIRNRVAYISPPALNGSYLINCGEGWPFCWRRNVAHTGYAECIDCGFRTDRSQSERLALFRSVESSRLSALSVVLFR